MKRDYLKPIMENINLGFVESISSVWSEFESVNDVEFDKIVTSYVFASGESQNS